MLLYLALWNTAGALISLTGSGPAIASCTRQATCHLSWRRSTPESSAEAMPCWIMHTVSRSLDPLQVMLSSSLPESSCLASQSLAMGHKCVVTGQTHEPTSTDIETSNMVPST